MGRRLAVHVNVDGDVYGPGRDIPDEVAERITNPDAWAPDGEDTTPAPEGQSPRRRGGRSKTAQEPATPARQE